MKTTHHIRLVIALSLIFLLPSCDKNEELANRPTGPEVPVRIRLLGVSEGPSSSSPRAVAPRQTEPVITPLGDGILMEMSLEEDAAPLRAAPSPKPLEADTKFRVIAVKSADNTYLAHGDFIAQDGNNTNTNLHVPAGESCHFICVSYNDDTSALPTWSCARGDALPTFAVKADADLLYWKTTSPITVNSATDAELSITLKHQLAKIRVLLDCTYNGWDITAVGAGITLSTVTTNATINLISQTISGYSNGTQTISWPSPLDAPDPEQLSDSFRIVPPGSDPLIISFPKEVITRESPLCNLPTYTYGLSSHKGNFSTTIAPGGSYILRVKFRTPKWAGSNIYWNSTTSKLDFYEHGTTTYQGYQGVFFRAGSLMGISPATPSSWGNTIPVYKPDVNESSGWKIVYFDTFSEISYWDHEEYGTTLNNNYADTDFVGDICQYLKSTYRLPIDGEFGVYGGNWDSSNPMTVPVDGWVKGTSSFPSSDAVLSEGADGTVDFITDKHLGYVVNKMIDDVAFPASGFRGLAYNVLDYVGLMGRYWSSSIISQHPENNANMMFHGYGISCYGSSTIRSSTASAIRCVKY